MKLNLVKNLGKKSQKEYLALAVDLGYRESIITFDTTLIAEITGLSFAEMHALKVGDKKLVAEIKVVK